MIPQRIQLSRAKGWRKPAGAIVVARPTRWGNPWPLDAVIFGAPHGWPLLAMTADLAVTLYRTALTQGKLPYTVADVQAELAGHDLACWCPPGEPCHADVLLELANPDVCPVPDRDGRACHRTITTGGRCQLHQGYVQAIGPTEHLETVEYWRQLYLDAITGGTEALESLRSELAAATARAQRAEFAIKEFPVQIAGWKAQAERATARAERAEDRATGAEAAYTQITMNARSVIARADEATARADATEELVRLTDQHQRRWEERARTAERALTEFKPLHGWVEVMHTPGSPSEDGKVWLVSGREKPVGVPPEQGINGHVGTWITVHPTYWREQQ